MGKLEGSATEQIGAPVQRCYEIAADVDHISEWQDGVQQVEVVERDGDGRPLVVDVTNDAKIRTIRTRVRFDYDPPDTLSWHQESGDLKSLVGSWSFEPSGRGTRATYRLQIDPGRTLGLLIRGPVEGRLRDLLVHSRPRELKARAERAA